MRKYSLSRHPAEHYPKYFRPDALVLVAYRAVGCRIGEDELAFNVWVESHDGAVCLDLVEVAREVLEHIVELDLFASEIDPRDESQAHLAHVEITREMIHLYYYATSYNSEWRTTFKRVGPGEFEFLV